MHLRRNAALAGAATFAALAAPGAASAATLAPLKPCYVAVPSSPPQVEQIDISGSGYTPNSRVDIAVDGADQIAPDGWIVKGGGGAHTREKIVAAASNRFVVIADASLAPHHAELVLTDDGRAYVTDCATDTGTWVQDEGR